MAERMATLYATTLIWIRAHIASPSAAAAIERGDISWFWNVLSLEFPFSLISVLSCLFAKVFGLVRKAHNPSKNERGC